MFDFSAEIPRIFFIVASAIRPILVITDSVSAIFTLASEYTNYPWDPLQYELHVGTRVPRNETSIRLASVGQRAKFLPKTVLADDLKPCIDQQFKSA